MRPTLATIILAFAVVTMTACGRTTPATADKSADAQKAPSQTTAWSPSVEPVASPAAGSTSEPQLTVSTKGALLSWIETAGPKATLKFAERTSGGWSEVHTAASGNDWFLSWADVPAVMRLSNGTLLAQWPQATNPDIEAYDVRLATSKDNGMTWGRSFLPHHDGTKTQHGFVSLFELPAGGVGLVWLDGRAAELDTASAEGGAMSLRYAAFDGNWKQTADMAVDTRVCECCQTSAAVTADGVLTAFRNRTDKEIRDIHVSRLEDGKWTEPTPVHNDNWDIPACPVNGPAVSARGKNAAIAWFTVKNDQGQAYAAFSNDAGRSWSAPIRLDEGGSTGRVDIEMLEDGSAVATWVESGANQRAQLRARRVEPSGESSKPFTIADGTNGRINGHPRVVRSGEEVLFAWTASGSPNDEEGNGMLRVQTAAIRLPASTR